MRNSNSSWLWHRGARYCVGCLLLAAGAAWFAACADLGGPMEWATYTIHYHYRANDGTPRVRTAVYRYGTFQPLATDFIRVGHDLLGWATDPDTADFENWVRLNRVAVRDLVSEPGQTIELFAVWLPHSFTVVYNSGDDSTADDRDFIVGNRQRLKSMDDLSFSPPCLDSVFIGWASKPGGLARFAPDDYTVIACNCCGDRDVEILSPEGDGAEVNLFAVWAVIPDDGFTITFDFNGGINEGGDINYPWGGVRGPVWLPHQRGLSFSRTGYNFVGWNVERYGEPSTDLGPGDRFIPSGSTTLFAQWSPIGAYFTVSFNPNGAMGTNMRGVLVSTQGNGMVVPSAGNLSQPGHIFIGWSEYSHGGGRNFIEGQLFLPSTSVTLFARWHPTDGNTAWTATAGGSPYTTSIDFVFDAPVPALNTSEITINGGTGMVTTGALSGGGMSWSLEVTGASPGNVYISIARPGITVLAQRVEVFGPTMPDTVTWTAIASSAPYTTAINFVFSAQVSSLNVGDIRMVGVSGATVTPGNLSGSGTLWSLEITNVANPGYIYVSIENRPDIAADPQTVEVFGPTMPDTVTWTAIASSAPYTTAINFVFSAQVSGLNAGDIRMVGVSGATVTPGNLSGSGTLWSLEIISVPLPGYITVSIENRPDIAADPQTVEVFGPGLPAPAITWTAIAYGFPTTAIKLVFSAPVLDLDNNDITVTDGAGAVTWGNLTGSGTLWTLGVSGVASSGDISISVAMPGVTGGPQTVTVYDPGLLPPQPITWVATATGSHTTTHIVVLFSAPLETSPGITILPGVGSTGGAAQSGALTGSGNTWHRAVSRVVRPGYINLTVSGPGIEGGTRQVAVHRPDYTWTATAYGTPTTAINLTFYTAVE
ncbi:MAG: InlB B-repeat-containing protein, partial [Treponema sp.]|nr:InlB B-repeat-containing protein [Treponema sp.]